MRPSRIVKTRDSDLATQTQRRVNFETDHDTQIESSDSSVEEDDIEDDTSSKASKSSEKTFEGVRKCKS